MPDIEVEKEPIYVFEVEATYLFTHYFERTDIFAEVRDYYDGDEYRFEVPTDEFDEVQEFLEGHYYEPIVVDDIEEFAVVKEQYTEHADILRNSVMDWTRRDHHFFVVQDPMAVERAVERGARRVAETDLVLGV